jgi:protein-S-isoprenylcysteine O-methyltransferase Ste14
MRDAPILVLTATIWAYWIGVGIMAIWVLKKTRKSSGVVPEQRLERLMWLIWVPLVISWIVLPYLATTQSNPRFAVPEFVSAHPALSTLRWVASLLAFLCFLMTIECWVRMGENWRMGVLPDQKTDLITSGLYAHVRHPIYALSILLMLCSALIVPTVPMITVAAVHVVLIILKARNEEHFLLKAHGELYEEYSRRTGHFFPRFTSPKS